MLSCDARRLRSELAAVPMSSAVENEYAAGGSKSPRSKRCLRELYSARSTSFIVMPSTEPLTAARRLSLYESPELMSHCPSVSASAVDSAAVFT